MERIWPAGISWCTIAIKPEKVEALVARVAEIGYEGVELWGPHVEEYEKRNGEIDSLVTRIRALGLAVPAISVYFDWFNDSVPDNLELARRYIRFAESFGTRILRAWVGPLGSAQMSAEHWDKASSGLRDVVRMCKEHGIVVAIETHRNQPMDTTDSTLKLLHQVGDGIQVVLDVYNLYQEGEDPRLVLDRLMPWVCHVHAKNLRDTPSGKEVTTLSSGDLDWDGVLAGLRSRGYRGWISVEYFGRDVWPCAVADLEYLRGFRNRALPA